MFHSGDKLYRWKDDEFEMVRVLKYSDDKYSIITTEGEKEVEKEDLFNYTKLKSDGFLLFTIVKMAEDENHGKDIIVSFFRNCDLDDNITIPYAVCRQNIYDTFSNLTNDTPDLFTYVGLSMNVENVPVEANFADMLVCHSVIHQERVNIYIEDNMDDILDLVIDLKPYDDVLSEISRVLGKTNEYVGYCASLKELLKDNNMLFDIHTGFNITEVGFNIDIKDNSICNTQVYAIENLLKKKIQRHFIMEYDRSYNINDIKREFEILYDAEGCLYIFAYDSEDYENHYYKERRDTSEILDMIRGMDNEL